MSFWIYRKEKDGRSFVYSITVPIELIIIVLGLMAAILLPRYFHDSVQFGKDALILSFLGFSLFLASKISLFQRGIWNSWGTKQMSKPFSWLYIIGYTLMVIGLIGSLLFYMREVA